MKASFISTANSVAMKESLSVNLESQVCTLELSKQLKELWVKQESYFYWSNIDTSHPRLVMHFDQPVRSGDFWISAFTVAELMDLLPLMNGCPLTLMKGFTLTDGMLYCARYDTLAVCYTHMESMPDKYAANALAKMLIFLLENKLMELPR